MLKLILFDAPVCCVSLSVGAPLRHIAADDMVPSAKRYLCALCHRDLAKVKHKHRHGAGHACHPRCKPSKRVLDPPATVPDPPIRSHKRSRSDPGKQSQPITHQITTPPIPLHLQSTYPTHGWSFHHSTRASRAAAQSWFELGVSDELKEWEKKRGNFYQHDTSMSLNCSLLDEKRVRLRHSSECIGRARLAAIGVDSASLKLGDIKLLRSAYGEGLQEIHYDITEYARAIRCYSVLMYLTSTTSTAVSILPLKEIRNCFTERENRPSAYSLNHLSHDKFYTAPVQAGDTLTFNCTVPHYGVANPDKHDRYVLFLFFHPPSTPAPDTEMQRYPYGVTG